MRYAIIYSDTFQEWYVIDLDYLMTEGFGFESAELAWAKARELNKAAKEAANKAA
jgi:hypothetical protein